MSELMLPEGWVKTKINDISVKVSQRKPGDSDEFFYIDISSVNRETKKINNPDFICGTDAPSRARKILEEGDVLVSLTRPNLNAVALVDEKYDGHIASTGFEVIRPVLIESGYIYAIVRSLDFVNKLSKDVQGALYPAAKSSDVQSYEIPLPPLKEQKEIVRILENHLTTVSQIQARLDAIPKLIEKFRQSVLNDAVSGRLTEGLEGCKECNDFKLEEISNILDPHPSHRTPKVVEEDGIPYIGIGNLLEDGTIDFANARKVSKTVLEEHNERYKLKKGDFIFGKIGTLGKPTLLPLDIDYALSANVILIQPSLESVNPDFLRLLLSAPSVMAKITSQSSATSQRAFGIKKMRSFEASIPSMFEQNLIVERIKQLFAYANQIEKSVAIAKARVDNLTQSILHQAFTGKLTEEWRKQNPELITGDNSAEALLVKIEAEKKENKAKKKK